MFSYANYPRWVKGILFGLVAVLLTACGGGGSSTGGGGGGTGGGGGGGGGGGSGSVFQDGTLTNANAYWLTQDTISWPGVAATSNYKLYFAANGGMTATSAGVAGSDGNFILTIDSAGLSNAIKAKFIPAQAGLALKISSADAATVGTKLQGQVLVAEFGSDAKLIRATSLQTAGVLDDLYASNASNASLGTTFDSSDIPTFKVWAPTAQSVSLNIYADANTSTKTSFPLTFDASTGIWSYTAPDANWTNTAYYTYTVNVVSRWANNALVQNEVSDPYSVSLNANGVRSFVANLDDSALKPVSWDSEIIPALAVPMDISLYELHIRDFSFNDSTVPSADRGKYLAFTNTASNGMKHLKLLQQAGLTHVHLLPTFDFASVPEIGCTSPVVASDLANAATQQSTITSTKDTDCFNWGYDPVHYNAPEGSYSSDANNGAARVIEFRQMVKSLHANGLRVVMDVVFNHTSAAHQDSYSVLDKIVPGYYYRLDNTGSIKSDSCCRDVANENAMMGKLTTDSVKWWATQYHVDGFRFDVMGMIPSSVMNSLQVAVNAATPGRGIYMYGEGWNYALGWFTPSTQANMAGTGIGTFNDRLRDAVRGGGCCDIGNSLISSQSFTNGAFFDPNSLNAQNQFDLLDLGDRVRVGLAGTLSNYTFTNRSGTSISSGSLGGYVTIPSEAINYIEAHDGQTLFDINAYKLPQNTTLADRVRVQNLGSAIVLLAQGIPFVEAGQEILRSKSMDGNSYNSGDWFNLLDYSYLTNNFGVGLPPSGDNQTNWSVMSPILNNSTIKPNTAAITSARDVFIDFLKIRYSSTLFRLRAGQDIRDRLVFFNVGASQVPGVIVEAIDGQNPSAYPGSVYKSVVTVFNSDKVAHTVTVGDLAGKNLSLHPVQLNSTADSIVKGAAYNNATGAFTVPPRTAAVFVQP